MIFNNPNLNAWLKHFLKGWGLAHQETKECHDHDGYTFMTSFPTTRVTHWLERKPVMCVRGSQENWDSNFLAIIYWQTDLLRGKTNRPLTVWQIIQNLCIQENLSRGDLSAPCESDRLIIWLRFFKLPLTPHWPTLLAPCSLVLTTDCYWLDKCV
jgi:hypothetical protein